METITIQGSRWKASVLLLGGIAFLGIVLILWTRDLGDIRLPLVTLPLFTAMGLLAVVVPAVHLIRPPILTLSATGLVQRTFYGEMSRPWEQMETPTIAQTVVWRLKKGAPRPRPLILWLNRLGGYDENLFGMWTLSPKALLHLVQRYHAAATGRC